MTPQVKSTLRAALRLVDGAAPDERAALLEGALATVTAYEKVLRKRDRRRRGRPSALARLVERRRAGLL